MMRHGILFGICAAAVVVLDQATKAAATARLFLSDPVPVLGDFVRLTLVHNTGAAFGLYYRQLSVLARRDGIAVQPLGDDDWFGYGDANETPDWEAARAAVAEAGMLFPDGAAGGETS